MMAEMKEACLENVHPDASEITDTKDASDEADTNERFLRNVFIPAGASGSLGLHLSRTPWDPYPWVSGVLPSSCAEQAGIRVGDCVLEANGEDLLGLKIVDIAKRVRNGRHARSSKPGVNLLLWNSGFEKNNLNPQSLSRFASCLQGIAGLLECPVCLEVIHPPSWQCCHGHLICSGCRAKSSKCPICRVMLGRGRCIVADKLFAFLVQTLGHHEGETRPVAQKSSNLQSVNARLPLFARDRAPCKQSPKLKANPPGALAMTTQQIAKVTSTSAASSVPFQYCCPSGQPCGKMKNQHDILIHLQKSHQTSVVQYYATAGDTLSIKFNESCVTCVVLIPSVRDENNNNCDTDDRGPLSNDNCTKSTIKTVTGVSNAAELEVKTYSSLLNFDAWRPAVRRCIGCGIWAERTD
ncbi:uncharacterized protein LOC129763008 isoform X1 [Toxorhynchites rutilus septentrionalis]|uniref:uncharacterized protein LOC129763008 isoform X1 n=1 Tax=Toxorhynchites rutilus septentrionalis TaxID=329112 RepID=UPI0024795040|nr:uncharacterized protein LOC129763008 isoform X1 [Toxorhynchites rutilus septentrionalis]XP_055617682.1 uncharacterized protein LOC129763008 isoform X1 [Toxorhynchites rutilus septentrionalis]XP_055617683.1 uncharacterized protein LOC129763008 isoform X1 [Toxorhynchites rutilus septentrionalis]